MTSISTSRSTSTDSSPTGLSTQSSQFLDWLGAWQASLPALDLAAFIAEKGIDPAKLAVVSVDLIDGFAYQGRLASPRIAGVVESSATLFKRAYELGVRNFVLLQEYHTPHAEEFHQFGPHGIRDTDEAKTVAALAALPFSETFEVIHKNSIHPAIDTRFPEWLSSKPEVNTFIVVGDCTDLCVYQTVMYLKLSANAVDKPLTVILPADCVQTYDLPVGVAEQIGALPHDGDLLHSVFLYHMALNGALVVRSAV